MGAGDRLEPRLKGSLALIERTDLANQRIAAERVYELLGRQILRPDQLEPSIRMCRRDLRERLQQQMHALLGREPADEHHRIARGGLAAGGEEPLVDAIGQSVAAHGEFRESGPDGLGYGLAAAEDQRRIGEPGPGQIAVEVDQSMVVAMQHDNRARIVPPHDRDEIGRAVDMDDIQAAACRIARHPLGEGAIIETAHAQRSRRRGEAETIHQVERPDQLIQGLGVPAELDAITSLTWLVVCFPARIHRHLMGLGETARHLVGDDRQSVVKFEITAREPGMRVDQANFQTELSLPERATTSLPDDRTPVGFAVPQSYSVINLPDIGGSFTRLSLPPSMKRANHPLVGAGHPNPELWKIGGVSGKTATPCG